MPAPRGVSSGVSVLCPWYIWAIFFLCCHVAMPSIDHHNTMCCYNRGVRNANADCSTHTKHRHRWLGAVADGCAMLLFCCVCCVLCACSSAGDQPDRARFPFYPARGSTPVRLVTIRPLQVLAGFVGPPQGRGRPKGEEECETNFLRVARLHVNTTYQVYTDMRVYAPASIRKEASVRILVNRLIHAPTKKQRSQQQQQQRSSDSTSLVASLPSLHAAARRAQARKTHPHTQTNLAKNLTVLSSPVGLGFAEELHPQLRL